MVLITEDLVRKKAEHNEGIIGTLEELSLHQEDVEKIEHLNNWCKNLQILYLQANLIPKIENLNKLKKLEYLNLAINNIEKIENLERCESLQKLDLTLNFIGDLESVCSLVENRDLRHLFLTGNPCCEFPGYRDYVIAKLPQLETLDSSEITKSERIKAQQIMGKLEAQIRYEQEKYAEFRALQKSRLQNNSKADLSDEDFWQSKSENAPETRVEIALRAQKNKNTDKEQEKAVKKVSFFAKSGRPLNINQGKLKFTFSDEDPAKFVLILEVYKYLDTSLIDVDLQPVYVRISVKEKIFQFVLPEEISTDKSTAKRSQITGHLVLEMPKANYNALLQPKHKPKKSVILEEKSVKTETESSSGLLGKFGINPDVPPLEYGGTIVI